MVSIQQQLESAKDLHRAGKLGEAEEIYRRILLVEPRNPDALHLIGVVIGQSGRPLEAIKLIEAALAINDTVVEYHFNLGHAHMATKSFQTAAVSFERALKLRPNDMDVLLALGQCRCDQSFFDRAIETYRAALRPSPNRADLHADLAIALRKSGEVAESLASFDRALAIEPQRPEILMERGISFAELDRLDEAMNDFTRVAALAPKNPFNLYNLGTTCYRLHRYDQAIDAFSQAIAIRPGYATPYNNLANSLTRTGRVAEGVNVLNRGLAITPDDQCLHSNRLYYLQFHPNYDAAAIHGELKRWNDTYAAPLAQPPPFFPPHRRLRIGYVSPDFFFQAECHFTVPLLEHHDRSQFEVHCYSNVRKPDHITTRIKSAADVWHDARDLSDAGLAAKIRSDEIDILVDLTMHMRENRLLAFARKPAPIQVTWLAYPGSTGLDAMDYRLTDPWMDPPGNPDPYAEKSIHLPHGWCCFDPLIDVPFLPQRKPGPIRFGSLNNPCKLNEKTIRLWARILLCVPDSRLLLLCGSSRQCQIILSWMADCGISTDRLGFSKFLQRDQYLPLYDDIDIALDPLPYNGITTTCDSLWMGVPVVTLAGPTAAGRAGLSLVSTVGLPELAAKAPAEFVNIAADLAADPPRLAHLRSTLRQRMTASPLMNAPAFARDVEDAYRKMCNR